MDSLKKFFAPKNKHALTLRAASLALLALWALAPSAAHAQFEEAVEKPLPDQVEVYRDALDPSGPADEIVPNPLTFFEVQEKKKTVRKMPQSLSERTIPNPQMPQATAPVPPRKPAVLNASQNFVAKARADAKRQDEREAAAAKKAAMTATKPQPPQKPQSNIVSIKPVKTPEKTKPQKAAVKTAPTKAPATKTRDVVAEDLVQPSLHDIWRSIDPKAAKEEENRR